MKNLQKKILSEIKNQKIKPKSRWYFFGIESFIWFCFFVLTILSAISITLVFFLIFNLDWNLNYLNHFYFFQSILLSIPYLWISIFFLCLFFSVYQLRQTKKGYRFSIFKIIILIIFLNLLLGFFVYKTRSDEQVHQFFYKKIPLYQKTTFTQQHQWNRPQKGFLGGEIIEIRNPKSFLLKDFSEKIWEISLSDKTFIAPMVQIKKEERIKIIGKKYTENSFQAIEIRSWKNKNLRNRSLHPSLKKFPFSM